MATCKDCLHCEACTSMLEAMGYIVDGDGIKADERCKQFEHRGKYAEVVHARWEFAGVSAGRKIYRCTNCKTLIYGQGDYCQVCGAKMDGGQA